MIETRGPVMAIGIKILEVICALKFVGTFLFGGFGCLFFAIYLLSTRLYFIPLIYLVWFVWDRDTSEKGGRRLESPRNWRVWRLAAEYFPMKLHKTVDIATDRNYVFAYHPHGILGFGAFMHFATNGTHADKIFPGLRRSLLILKGQFDFPFYREYLMLAGLCAVTKRSIEWMLTREGKGNAVVIIIGGAKEALEAHPGRYCIDLKERKGFIKIAMRHGADIVPVFSFGENDIYHQVSNPKGSRLRNAQEWLMQYTGFSPPILMGRGFIQKYFGMMPFRRPVNTVVGSPIPVEKIAEPSREQIKDMHAIYIKKLEELFEEHKGRFGVSEDTHITYM
ncbi:2-acylglycerol O-acyltransferase 1-like isoform X1 [Lineus longissimus]|uniref:2-acylglycerol O-acyltransferase 1-like isoform X1 n=1 Tax=Lineus longissimus TaxID=88925 RepID=UPI002B4DB26D